MSSTNLVSSFDPYPMGMPKPVGCDAGNTSSPLPPPYKNTTANLDTDYARADANVFITHTDQSTQTIQADQIHAIVHPAINAARWSKLITACEQAKIDLEFSLTDLEKNWLKTYFLNKEEKSLVQQQIKAGLSHILSIHEAAQDIYKEETAENLAALKKVLKGLDAIKPTVCANSSTAYATVIQNENVHCWKNIIKNYIGPVALMAWASIVQSGILHSETAKSIPLIGGIIGLCLKIKESFYTCIENVKTEDQVGLIKICDSLIETCTEINMFNAAIEAMRSREENSRFFQEFSTTAMRNREEDYKILQASREEMHSHLNRLKALDNLDNLNNLKELDKLNDLSKLADLEKLGSRLTNVEKQLEIVITLLEKKLHAQPLTGQQNIKDAV